MVPSRDERAKAAKEFINRKLPAILKSNTKARKGVDSAELIVDPPAPVALSSANSLAKSSSYEDPATKQIRLWVTDTLEAAHRLSGAEPSRHKSQVAILNMASPLRPGGGVLTGASSQEEWLCSRTTLYPSLRESFYRLPEVGGVYTPDVLVCKMWDLEATELKPAEQYFVNVITAAMLRLPDIEQGENGEMVYAEQKDRDLALQKIRAVMRILRAKGAEKVVLGAWGCGAYANPVPEVAKAWRRALLGSKSKKGARQEEYSDMEIVFAIKDSKMAHRFAQAFGPELVLEGSFTSNPAATKEEEEEGEEIENHSKSET